MAGIDAGERVATTVVHLNEISNKLSKGTKGGMPEAHRVVRTLLESSNVDVLDVARSDYSAALALAEQKSVDIADALAWILMQRVLQSREVYTMNRKHFRVLSDDLVLLPPIA